MCIKKTRFTGGRFIVEQQFDPSSGEPLFSRHIPLCPCADCKISKNPSTPNGTLHEVMALNADKDAAEARAEGFSPPISVFSEPGLDPRTGKKRPAKKLVQPWVRKAKGDIPREIVVAYG
ncbi:hypothetical protein KKD40_01895 [Candidatus Micrarchaeota archaeon]|nr:hypothetical protein [Candidatus Micrarchaeota archaeon]